MFSDSEAPWVFRRDELHLLEDGFEEILRRHDAAQGSPEYPTEQLVLREQMETEEVSEFELTLKLGSEWVEPLDQDAGPRTVLAQELPIKEQLLQSQRRDPLYASCVHWANAAHGWSREEYYQRKNTDQHVYRVHVNAFLVPIKVHFAQTEQGQEDSLALDIAAKEYELAEVYLDRARDSLAILVGRGVPCEALLSEAAALLERIHRERERIENQRRFRGDLM